MVILLALCAQPAPAQDSFIKTLQGITNVNDAIEKLLLFFNRTDTVINRAKMKEMAAKLYTDIDDIIVAKTNIIATLKRDTALKQNYYTQFTNLSNKVDELNTTLSTYKDLIQAAGADAATLSTDLKLDIGGKKELLQYGINDTQNLKNGNNTQLRTNLITYLNGSVIILKAAQASLLQIKG